MLQQNPRSQKAYSDPRPEGNGFHVGSGFSHGMLCSIICGAFKVPNGQTSLQTTYVGLSRGRTETRVLYKGPQMTSTNPCTDGT